jgi:hypothetical protein
MRVGGAKSLLRWRLVTGTPGFRNGADQPWQQRAAGYTAAVCCVWERAATLSAPARGANRALSSVAGVNNDTSDCNQGCLSIDHLREVLHQTYVNIIRTSTAQASGQYCRSISLHKSRGHRCTWSCLVHGQSQSDCHQPPSIPPLISKLQDQSHATSSIPKPTYQVQN